MWKVRNICHAVVGSASVIGGAVVVGSAAVAMSLMLTGCDGTELKPSSGGDPYEVLLVTTDKASRQIVDSVLQEPLPALPQKERWFSVSHFDADSPGKAMRYARCIVTIETDSTLFKRTLIRYKKDVHAKHQLIVTISAPSAATLRKDMVKGGQRLRELLDRFELNTEAEALRRNHNAEATKATEGMFGWSILVPKDLTAMKKGDHFLWFSNDGTESCANICVYSYAGTSLNPDRNIAMRDSIMGRNIHGELPSMHMKTERRLPIVQRMANEKGRAMLACRGLWQMEGDAMGGPFVSLAVADSSKGMTIVAEGFVFAPGNKKRNAIKRLEAALYTLAKGTN